MNEQKSNAKSGERQFRCGPMAEFTEKMARDPRLRGYREACRPMMDGMVGGCCPAGEEKAPDRQTPDDGAGAVPDGDGCKPGPCNPPMTAPGETPLSNGR